MVSWPVGIAGMNFFSHKTCPSSTEPQLPGTINNFHPLEKSAEKQTEIYRMPNRSTLHRPTLTLTNKRRPSAATHRRILWSVHGQSGVDGTRAEPTPRPCTLAELESETAAAGKTCLLETAKPAAGTAEETLKYYVWIEVYKQEYTQRQ